MQFERPSLATPADLKLSAGATFVDFTRATDRWRHEIRTADGRHWLSIEGVHDDVDPRGPESPVLTEVSLQEVDGRPVLLGVGLAGRSHFSLCVTVHSEEDTLLFETACRVNARAERLGSTYRVKDGHTVRVEALAPFEPLPATVCWNYTAGPAGLQAVPPAVTRTAGG